MLATRWLHPLARRNKSLIKRSYFNKYDRSLVNIYPIWIIGHTAGGFLIGGISFPLSYFYERHEELQKAGNPINNGMIFLESLPMATVGMAVGAMGGMVAGIPGPLSYIMAGGGYWLWNHNKK